MSEINCFGTEEYYGEVIPGWGLVRLVSMRTKNTYMTNPMFSMKEGSWGLTYPEKVIVLRIFDSENSNIGLLGCCTNPLKIALMRAGIKELGLFGNRSDIWNIARNAHSG